eukprot:2068037-Prymnesium_polylepis.1
MVRSLRQCYGWCRVGYVRGHAIASGCLSRLADCLPLIQPVWLACSAPELLPLPRRPNMAKRCAPIIAGTMPATPPPPLPLAAAEPPMEPAADAATDAPTDMPTTVVAVAAACSISVESASVAALLTLRYSATLSPLPVTKGGGDGGGGGENGGRPGAQAADCLKMKVGVDTLNALAVSPSAAEREAAREADEDVST